MIRGGRFKHRPYAGQAIIIAKRHETRKNGGSISDIANETNVHKKGTCRPSLDLVRKKRRGSSGRRMTVRILGQKWKTLPARPRLN